VTTDAAFTCKSRSVARALSQAQKEPVYRYFFNQTLESDPQLKALRVAHTIEHPFLFGWQGTIPPERH
jgi:carboxylesterase type B